MSVRLLIPALALRRPLRQRCPRIGGWARDTQGNLRVLKAVKAGFVSFEAGANDTPPILMPASVAQGQTWAVFGPTMTVMAVSA